MSLRHLFPTSVLLLLALPTLAQEESPREKRAMAVEEMLSGRDDASLATFAREHLMFEPGTNRKHSHCAWGVLAAVVEVASGQAYEAYLRENFFEPAEMKRTGHYPLAGEFPAAEVAVGLGGNVWGEVNSPPYWGETSWLVLGSGGMVSTPRDLVRWRKFLRHGDVLGSAAQRKLGMGGVMLGEGGNDRGFVTTLGSRGDDLVIVCSNSHTALDGYSSRLAIAVARLGSGE